MAEMDLFVEHGDLPVAPGDLKPTNRLEKALLRGEVEIGFDDFPIGIDRIGQIIGTELVQKVVPPTPARVVEVAYPLVEDHVITTGRKVTFMQSVLEGAMKRKLR